MKNPLTQCLVVVFLVAATLTSPVAGQRGGGGGKKSEPSEIFRPVLISYPGFSGGGSAARYPDPNPRWMTEIHGWYEYFHPDQMTLDGGNRNLVRAVSIRGDLTHGGGSRFVLDVREASDGSHALIATAETVGTSDNPTWYYDGPGGDDDATDHVLLTDSSYLVERARWSRSGTRIAFQGTSVATGDFGIFVGDVAFGAAGEPDGLGNIALVALNGQSPNWGDDQRIAFIRGQTGGEGFTSGGGPAFVVDISVAPPVELTLGDVASPPELDATGTVAIYARSVGSRNEVFVRDLVSGVETQVTDPSRVPEADVGYPTWLQDPNVIVFSITDGCCSSLATLDLLGSGSRTMITKTFVEHEGSGRNKQSLIVGSAASVICRQ